MACLLDAIDNFQKEGEVRISAVAQKAGRVGSKEDSGAGNFFFECGHGLRAGASPACGRHAQRERRERRHKKLQPPVAHWIKPRTSFHGMHWDFPPAIPSTLPSSVTSGAPGSPRSSW